MLDFAWSYSLLYCLVHFILHDNLYSDLSQSCCSYIRLHVYTYDRPLCVFWFILMKASSSQSHQSENFLIEGIMFMHQALYTSSSWQPVLVTRYLRDNHLDSVAFLDVYPSQLANKGYCDCQELILWIYVIGVWPYVGHGSHNASFSQVTRAWTYFHLKIFSWPRRRSAKQQPNLLCCPVKSGLLTC